MQARPPREWSQGCNGITYAALPLNERKRSGRDGRGVRERERESGISVLACLAVRPLIPRYRGYSMLRGTRSSRPPLPPPPPSTAPLRARNGRRDECLAHYPDIVIPLCVPMDFARTTADRRANKIAIGIGTACRACRFRARALEQKWQIRRFPYYPSPSLHPSPPIRPCTDIEEYSFARFGCAPAALFRFVHLPCARTLRCFYPPASHLLFLCSTAAAAAAAAASAATAAAIDVI